MKKEILVEIANKNDTFSFASFCKGDKNSDTLKIRLNLKNIFLACAEHDLDFYDFVTESVVHELLHGFQEIFKRKFSEKEVEEILERAKKTIKEVV